MNLLKEIFHFYRFFWGTPKEDKKIVFCSENENYYPNFEGLVTTLTNKYQQSFCYITSDLHDSILETLDPKIKVFYLNKLLPLFMVYVNCQAFIMTLTDFNQYHLKRSINPVHYVYVFHSIVSTHMMYRAGAFDYYDSILCVGPHHIREIRQYEQLHQLPAKKLIKAGYYRLERIYEAYQQYSRGTAKPAKKTILIAPSWGIDNVIESCGPELVGLLLNSNFNVIVRPHPETIKRYPKTVTSLAAKFGHHPKFFLEKSIVTDSSLFQAAVLITDYSGISLEYAFGTQRPVLFIDVPPKIKNQKFNELDIEPIEISLRSKIGSVVSPKKLHTIPQAIDKLISNREAYRKHLVELREQNIYNFKNSSDIGAQYIIDIINKK